MEEAPHERGSNGSGSPMTAGGGYVETNLPLLEDRQDAHLLEVDSAGRKSRGSNQALCRYDVQGGVLPEAPHKLTGRVCGAGSAGGAAQARWLPLRAP